jgi:hypothetical protein
MVAPIVWVAATAVVALVSNGGEKLAPALLWQSLLAFLLLTISMALLSPLLLLPLERKRLSFAWKAALTTLAICFAGAAVAFGAMGRLELLFALGLMLNALAYVLLVAGTATGTTIPTSP